MTETEKQHAEMVRVLAKPGEEIIPTITPEKMHLLHMAVGICGEAGELLDAVKKHIFYNQDVDWENIVEELGDLEFYMTGFRQGLCLGRHRTLVDNINKLKVRYGDQYSDEAAQARKDKLA